MDPAFRSALQQLAPSFSSYDDFRVLDGGRSTVLCVAEEIVVKQSKFANEEAEAMRYVAKHTTVPLPKLYGTHTEKDTSYIVMDYVAGDMLSNDWDKRSQIEKEALAEEVKGIADQLRCLSENYVGAVNRTPFVNDLLFPFDTYGPFDSQEEFHNFLAELYQREKPKSHFGSLLRKLLKDDYKIVFSHGDLNPNNIIIRNGHVVSIIDWEMAGFFPEYWEYARACLGIHWTNAHTPDYIDFVHSSLDPFRAEAWVVAIIDSSWRRIN